ncbi:MAG: diguanylate cyclase [Proteobacteria bacterium]|nr:diguanylate cyclase [Pseudomonadota bacterium]MBU1708790.1 diguanylate cyclase [Pseudomonadota bacterium]
MENNNDNTPETFAGLKSYRIKVLLIDDQQIIAEAVRRSLDGEKDIDFHYCQDPTKAINMAMELKPTLILQDLVMPEIDGLMMVRFFRVNPITSKVPIIVLSTKEEPEIKSEAFTVGANDYLVKLPDKVELIARIRYHSQSYINQIQKDEAFEALRKSQQQLAEANKTLQKLSSLDGLTGIANRRHFDEVLSQEWMRSMRYERQLSLILLDIDFFKLYNDNYGHQKGDECLKQVAASLEKSITRETDMIARYGGEEFVAVLPETGEKGAWKIAETMRENIQNMKILHEKSKVNDFVSVSLGVCTTIPIQDSKPEALIEAADQALYAAKEEGRNRVITGKMS